MLEQHLIIFSIIGAIGLAIIILGFKFSDKSRKVIETTGAIIFHVGIFGVLYHKVELNLFISLVALVVSLFILIDPLKISTHLNAKIYRLFGYIILFAAVAFSLDFFSGFPVWLWTVPLVIYLSPYLVSPLKKRMGLVLGLSWLVVFSYVALIGYVIYSKYNTQIDVAFIKKILPQLHIPQSRDKMFSEKDFTYAPPLVNEHITQKTVTPPPLQTNTPGTATTPHRPFVKITDITKPQQFEPEKKQTPQTETTLTPPIVLTPKPPDQTGPYLQSLKEADKKFLELQKDYNALKSRYEKITVENKELLQELDRLKGQDNTNAPLETL
ncbi:MAG: hypothetical protein HQM16_12920 [Deltaproteobacteria bacterium]|nr:hypothetical protein [Deltaproteobacteria bacterium]